MRRLSQQLLVDLASIPARQASQTLLNLAPFHAELAKRSRAPTLQRHRAYPPATGPRAGTGPLHDAPEV